MCGICGLIDFGERSNVSESLLRSMTDSIAHRGPDGDGVHLEPGVGLGHRRLSIIDLSGGKQPMYNDDRSVVIVFNGEIYNYKELRKDLIAKGEVLQTESDTEVIIRLYERYGTDCLQHLNGMFAFAIWDQRQRRLFAARDRLGEKPFYYAKQGERFAFASELKALRHVPKLIGEIDREALDLYLAFGYVPAPSSIHSGVRKLPAAHYLLLSDRGVHIERYWQPPPQVAGAHRRMEDYAEELRELLTESVRLRLRSDVPIGAFLSGGIDSSLIVAIASQLRDSPLNTFSVGFGEADFDESTFARIVAKQFQTNHYEMIVEPLDLSELPRLVAQFDEPFADASALPTHIVCKAAVQHVTVCLSGDAGDELFGGYPQYRYERFERILDALPQTMTSAVMGRLANAWPEHIKVKGWLGRMAVRGADRYQRKIGVFPPDERAKLYRPEFDGQLDRANGLLAPYFNEPGTSEIEARIAADIGTWLTDDILVKVDRNSMLNSLEVRVPFLDHRIVEFARRLPLSAKVRGTQQKILLKHLLRDLVPADILNRRKQGFGVPLKHWFRHEYRDYLRDTLLSPNARCREFFEPRRINELIAAHIRGPRDFSRRLWVLLLFELWLQGPGRS